MPELGSALLPRGQESMSDDVPSTDSSGDDRHDTVQPPGFVPSNNTPYAIYPYPMPPPPPSAGTNDGGEEKVKAGCNIPYLRKNLPMVVSLIAVITNIIIMGFLIPDMKQQLSHMQGQSDIVMYRMSEVMDRVSDANRALTDFTENLGSIENTVQETQGSLGEIDGKVKDFQIFLGESLEQTRNESKTQLAEMREASTALALSVDAWRVDLASQSFGYTEALTTLGAGLQKDLEAIHQETTLEQEKLRSDLRNAQHALFQLNQTSTAAYQDFIRSQEPVFESVIQKLNAFLDSSGASLDHAAQTFLTATRNSSAEIRDVSGGLRQLLDAQQDVGDLIVSEFARRDREQEEQWRLVGGENGLGTYLMPFIHSNRPPLMRFRKIDNKVEIRGQVYLTGPSLSTTFFELPPGYRPCSDVEQGNGHQKTTVQAGGRVSAHRDSSTSAFSIHVDFDAC